jgi:hypothetical protein
MIGSEKGKGRVIESLIIPQVINNRKISTTYYESIFRRESSDERQKGIRPKARNSVCSKQSHLADF